MVDIEMLDRVTGECQDTAGNLGHVTNWLDKNGAACDPADAIVAIAYCGCHWMSIDIRQLHQVSVH